MYDNIINIMKSKLFRIIAIPVLIISITIIVFASRTGDQEESGDMRRTLLLKVITFAIKTGHYDPGRIDDEFSKKAFKLYIDRIDYSKRFLLKEDIDKLSEYKTKLDDAMMEDNFDFLDLSSQILNNRTTEAEEYYKEILENPFDFKIDEKVEVDAEKRDFAKSKDELKEVWRLSLKYETMIRIKDMMEEQEKAAEKSDTVTIKSFDEIESEAREKIMKRYDDWFHRLSKLNGDDRLNTYINSLVNVFDPHTQYFPPKEKENFDIRFSGELEGIGAQLTQKNSYIEVIKIIPGSPSWKQGELEVGDYILKVAQEGEEPVDVVDMRLDEAVLLIRGPKGTKVTLTIKKLDGTIKNIEIVRDVVILEETYAKSALIKSKTGETYGYLRLPSFYVNFNKVGGKNCYDDVKTEIAKLKEENVDGIIFDLRGNGGGSLTDVVKIAGLFIKNGPVVQSKNKQGEIRVLKDEDPSTQYDGPLVVMVNAVSASASEIFAAAMQDYSRAIIVGGNHTFGKGTVQNFAELDRMVPRKPADMKSLGALKMTIQKFYRVNGGSTQLKGVTPDIIFPDYYNYLDFGEKDMDYPMPWDEVPPVKYFKWIPSYNPKTIEESERKIIKEDTLLKLIHENGKRLKEIRDDTELPLNYEKYDELITKREESGKRYEGIGKDTLGLAIRVLTADLPKIEADTSAKARSDSWITGLKKDIYLYETAKILDDIKGKRED